MWSISKGMVMFYGFPASNKMGKDLFSFSFLQSPNNSHCDFVYAHLYYCLKYFKTVQFVSVYETCSK